MQYRIGSIDPQDLDKSGKVPAEEIEDPFVDDPERSDRLQMLNKSVALTRD